MHNKNNLKWKVGIIGAGHWGPNLIRNFDQNNKCQVIAVADSSVDRINLIAQKYEHIKTTKSADDILNNPEINVVVIVTPTKTHYELAKKALQLGKHVFVEKPLATTAEECKELTSLAEKKGVQLFVGHIFVYNAGVRAVKKIIESGDLGKIYYSHVTRTNLGPIRTDVNSLWDLAPHDLSIFKYWFNEMPNKVSAKGGCFLNNNLHDAVFATYTFPSGMMANVHVSWVNPKKVREIVVVGEKKMLVWNDLDLNNCVTIYDKNVSLKKIDDNELYDTYVGFRAQIFEGDTYIPKIKLNEPLSAECDAFIQSLDNPAISLSNGVDGMMVVSALSATDLSAKENGKEIAITY